MFNIKKYKKFCQIKTFVYLLPRIRILKFKRPKWKLLQKRLTQICDRTLRLSKDSIPKQKKKKKKKSVPVVVKKQTLPFLNNLYFNSASKEQRFKKFYKNSLVLKRTVSVFFNDKLSTTDFKKLIQKRSSYLDKLWLDILIKPLYVLEILLCKLNFFKNIFELRQSLIKQEIYLNDKIALLNATVKKGDRISMPNLKLHKNTNIPMFLCPLVEVDYYNNNVIVLIDYLEFNLESLPVFYPERIDLLQLLDYIKNK